MNTLASALQGIGLVGLHVVALAVDPLLAAGVVCAELLAAGVLLERRSS